MKWIIHSKKHALVDLMATTLGDLVGDSSCETLMSVLRAALTSRSCTAPQWQQVHPLIPRPDLPFGLLAHCQCENPKPGHLKFEAPDVYKSPNLMHNNITLDAFWSNNAYHRDD